MVIYRMASKLAYKYNDSLCNMYYKLSSVGTSFDSYFDANFKDRFLSSIHKCCEDAVLDTLNYNFESNLFGINDAEIVYGRYLFRHLRNNRGVGEDLFDRLQSFAEFVQIYDETKEKMCIEDTTKPKDYSKFTFIEY